MSAGVEGGGSESVDEMIASDLWAQDNDEAKRTFNQRDSELPDLPVDENSYLHNEASFNSNLKSDGANDNDNANETLDEREMRRHFMDVESSFLPDVRAESADVQREESGGLDDTYLELGRPGHTPPPEEAIASLSSGGRKRALSGHLHPVGSNGSGQSQRTPSTAEEEVAHSSRDESSASSPAAAALQRTPSRNASAGRFAGNTNLASEAANTSRPSTPELGSLIGEKFTRSRRRHAVGQELLCRGCIGDNVCSD
jgi:hypothetical protein